MSVPVALPGVFELGQKQDIVAPGQLSNKLLDDCVIGISLSKRAHGEEVGAEQPRISRNSARNRPPAYSPPGERHARLGMVSDTFIPITLPLVEQGISLELTLARQVFGRPHPQVLPQLGAGIVSHPYSAQPGLHSGPYAPT